MNIVKPIICPRCTQVIPDKVLQQRKKSKSDNLKKAFELAKKNGDPVGQGFGWL